MPKLPPQQTPPGWYPDPYAPAAMVRFWDGRQWTEQAHPKPQPSGDFTVQMIMGVLLIIVILVVGFLIF